MNKIAIMLVALLALVATACDDGTPVDGDDLTWASTTMDGYSLTIVDGKGRPFNRKNIYIEYGDYSFPDWSWEYNDPEFWSKFNPHPDIYMRLENGVLTISPLWTYPSRTYDFTLVYGDKNKRWKIHIEYESSYREFKFRCKKRYFFDGVEEPEGSVTILKIE